MSGARMPATTPEIEQNHTPVEMVADRHPSTAVSSRVPTDAPHWGARRSVDTVQVAILEAELHDARTQRDRLREQVRSLEQRHDELREMARAAIAEHEGRDESTRQALIQRYERVIAEKDAAIDAALDGQVDRHDSDSSIHRIAIAVRETVDAFRT